MAVRSCVVGFVYNEPCPLRCDFCCHTKENVGAGRLRPENTIPVLTQFAQHPAVERFCFTGGDPFVYYKEIVEIMTAARLNAVQQPFHMVTSGFWADDAITCSERLETLSGLGMDLLYVSYDYEHAKWVSPENVYRIEDACDEHGVTLSVYGVFWELGHQVRDLLPKLRTKFTNQTLVSPIGRAKSQTSRLYKGGPDEGKHSCGRGLNYDLTIYPNGDTYPCCSGGFNKEAGLCVGNVFSENPETILARCFSNFLVIIAKEIGFDKLLRKLELRGQRKDLPQFNEITTVCEMCVAISRNRNLSEVIRDEINAMEIDYCSSLVTQLQHLQEGKSQCLT